MSISFSPPHAVESTAPAWLGSCSRRCGNLSAGIGVGARRREAPAAESLRAVHVLSLGSGSGDGHWRADYASHFNRAKSQGHPLISSRLPRRRTAEVNHSEYWTSFPAHSLSRTIFSKRQSMTQCDRWSSITPEDGCIAPAAVRELHSNPLHSVDKSRQNVSQAASEYCVFLTALEIPGRT